MSYKLHKPRWAFTLADWVGMGVLKVHTNTAWEVRVTSGISVLRNPGIEREVGYMSK